MALYTAVMLSVANKLEILSAIMLNDVMPIVVAPTVSDLFAYKYFNLCSGLISIELDFNVS
jgi:hypothetical protein